VFIILGCECEVLLAFYKKTRKGVWFEVSIHCFICGSPENWCCGKEYNFDDMVRIDVVDEFGADMLMLVAFLKC